MRWGHGITGAVALVTMMVGACRDWDQYVVESASTASASGGAGVGGTGGNGDGGEATGGNMGGGGSGGTPTPCGYIDVIDDDFASGIKDDAVWYDSAGDGGDSYVDVGAYVINLDLDYSYAYFGTESAYDLTGRTITIDAEEISLSGNQGMWFSIGADSDNYVEFWIQHGDIHFGREIGGTLETVAPDLTLDPSTRFFRFRESGGIVHWETSSNGVDFQEHASTTASDVFDIRYSNLEVGGDGDGLGATGHLRIDAVVGGPTPGALCKTDSLEDDFDDGSIGPAWSSWGGPLCHLSESNGTLVVQTDAGAVGADCGLDSRHAFDFIGSTATIEVVSVPGGASMWMFVSDPDEEDGVGFTIDDGTVYIVDASSGVYVDLTTMVYDDQAHRWMRLREQAGLVHWQASADGQTWDDLHVATPGAMTAKHVNLYLGAGASGTQVRPKTIELDNLNLTP